MNIWLILIGGGLVTYAIRLSFIFLLGRLHAPEGLQRGLRFVPPVVLTAIIIPELILPGGQLNISLGNARLLAGILAGLVAWRTRSPLLTIALGMAALLILQALLP